MRRQTITSVLVALTVFVIGVAVEPNASAVSNWGAGLSAGSTAQARADTGPATPGSITSSCQSSTTVSLTWPAVTHATNYRVYKATALAGPYTLYATTAATSYTTGSLGIANYWFEVAALVGTNWVSGLSVASAQRSITSFLVVFFSCA